jgi:RHS repeat-associated protein
VRSEPDPVFAINPILVGLGIDERFARNDVTGRTYFMSDLIGSTIALTDPTGVIREQYSYDPYGNVTPSDTTTGFTNPYQYFGREADSPGLYYYRARYYSPMMGSFIDEDPITFGGSQLSFYAYVDGSPLDNIDPFGLRPLNACEKCLLSPYIPKKDLDNANLHDGEVPSYLPKGYDGITRGNDIYFRPGVYDPCTPAGIAVLGHELVHVGQYSQGMTWISYLWSTRNGYENSKYEQPAYAMQDKIQNDLTKNGLDDCGCQK